ncbi:hypothetical protein [Streptomyces sp. NPDC089795]|uniref:hypothetical protein n=1 Tax=Streptomyces sp. NPDC089795 TaxID=3155297 RepID=UPI003432961A
MIELQREIADLHKRLLVAQENLGNTQQMIFVLQMMNGQLQSQINVMETAQAAAADLQHSAREAELQRARERAARARRELDLARENRLSVEHAQEILFQREVEARAELEALLRAADNDHNTEGGFATFLPAQRTHQAPGPTGQDIDQALDRIEDARHSVEQHLADLAQTTTESQGLPTTTSVATLSTDNVDNSPQSHGQQSETAGLVTTDREIPAPVDEAEALYLRAANSGHSGALKELGLRRERAGDYEAAEQYTMSAKLAGSIRAVADLVQLREKEGRYHQAESFALRTQNRVALRALVTQRYKDSGPKAAESFATHAAGEGYRGGYSDLAGLIEKDGHLEAAEALALRAADAGHPSALIALARLRERRRDHAAAEALALRAADAGHPSALIALTRLREDAGEHAAAETLYLRAANTDHPDTLVQLARLRERGR